MRDISLTRERHGSVWAQVMEEGSVNGTEGACAPVHSKLSHEGKVLYKWAKHCLLPVDVMYSLTASNRTINSHSSFEVQRSLVNLSVTIQRGLS